MNHNATLVIVAFATIQSDGTITLDQSLIPCAAMSNWLASGKKLMFSIGGQGAVWSQLFASNTSMAKGINSTLQILKTSPFIGVDLDLEDYSTSPFTVAQFILNLKKNLIGYYVSVTAECVGVYQGETVPTNSSWVA